MPHVITDPCVSTCDTACVDVCPVDAIHGPRSRTEVEGLARERRLLFVLGAQLVIDPLSCIDCTLCVHECPADAIFEESAVPARYVDAISRNAAYFT